MMMRLGLYFTLCWVLGMVSLSAQESSDPAASAPKISIIDQLETLAPGIEQASKNLEQARSELKNAETDRERAEAEAAVDEARAKLESMQDDFVSLASGVDEAQFLGKQESSGTLQQTAQDIFEPLGRFVREVTAEPREIEAIRQSLQQVREQALLAEQAVTRISGLLAQTQDEAVRSQLDLAHDQWNERLKAAEVQVNILDQQLEIRQQDQRSTVERISTFFRDFWRKRGLNLIFAAAAAILSILLVRLCSRLIARFIPKKGKAGVAGKTTHLVVQFAATLLAISSVLLVFYARGDWLLLALMIVILLGLFWASRQALPPYFEQIRIILNLGSVREGERMIYEGVPYRVKRLHFRCLFENPALEGGRIRLPVRDVIRRVSRCPGRDEPWFPCKLNEWVVLADGTYGKVVHQSPEQVVVLRLGGSRKVYSTSEFLEQFPENLSHGFRISQTFGIDYAHQAICTTKVPQIFQQAIEEQLGQSFDREAIRSVKVEFASVGTSSLDYEILADFDGSLASRRNVIQRRIQSICVDVCNAQNWGIPFTQLTLHHRGNPA